MEQFTCDTTPTSKGKCWCCHKIISKGTPRIWRYTRKTIYKGKVILKNMPIKKIICFGCVKHILNQEIKDIKEDLDNLRLIKKKFNRMLKGKRVKAAIVNNKILRELDKSEMKENKSYSFRRI
jgi:hypothetical protein